MPLYGRVNSSVSNIDPEASCDALSRGVVGLALSRMDSELCRFLTIFDDKLRFWDDRTGQIDFLKSVIEASEQDLSRGQLCLERFLANFEQIQF